MFKSLLGAIALAPLVATPVMAANSAAPLSLQSVARDGAVTDGKSNLAAPGAFVGLALFAAVIIGGVILAVTDDNNDDDIRPVSP